ncbi:substrate-binding domain-containing protein [Rathayibacter sp. VKM Ac-2760]|uniref:substrate-binding domain-containing protein n=1 Tax=Rathayibacter sp. VKM Ac-2760 TaxID=2609253 RepID=UPI00131727B5|nr:substrate-binding domain-containing protein [Rathayibacter sp. VKM Ac-2760]QHC58656.1 substrate-binding domain-containing protein [Rathayibacter sp. VKM Ac-2760]
MVAAARRDAVLRELELRGSVSSAALALRFRTSQMTVRRDLGALEADGLLVRVHGGAVSPAVAAQQQSRADPTAVRPAERPVATIGMIVPTSTYYFPEVIRGASQAARELNCRLVVGATSYSEAEELRQARRLIDRGVDALLITPRDALREGSELLDLLERAGLPVVIIERSIEESIAARLECVRSDHSYGIEIAVRHLLEQGHHRIALAARPVATAAGLAVGYERAMRSASGGRKDDRLRRELSHPPVGQSVSIPELTAFLDDCLGAGVTAAIVLGDADSMAFTDLVLERGLRVPQDFGVIAYDDEISALAAVPLTAVAPPKHELGHTALRLCVDRLRLGDQRARTVVRMILLPALVVRESTVREAASVR